MIAAVNRKRTLIVNTGNRKAAGFDCELAAGFNRHFAGNRAGLFGCFITECQAVCALNRNRLDASAEEDTVVAGKRNASRCAVDRNGFSISLDIGDKNRRGRCQSNSFICCSGRNGSGGTLKTARSHIRELQIFTGRIGSDDSVEHRQLAHCRGNLVVLIKLERTVCSIEDIAAVTSAVQGRAESSNRGIRNLSFVRVVCQRNEVFQTGVDTAGIFEVRIRKRCLGGLDGSGDVDGAGIRQLGVRADSRDIGDIDRAAALNLNFTI